MSNKGVPVSFRLLPDVKAALEKAAQDDSRSVSSLLNKLVSEWLREQEYLPK